MRTALVTLLLFTVLAANAQHRPKHKRHRHPRHKQKEIVAVAGSSQTGYASYYHDRFHGRKTTSGERYSKSLLTAAHRTLPLGTRLKVIDPVTKRWVIVRVNDRGPVPKKRIIDLSRRAARHLGMLNGKGVMKVRIEVLPEVEIIPDNSFRENEAQ